LAKFLQPCCPQIKDFIATVLEERPENYFDKELPAQVEQLDRALANGRSLAAQRKLEAHASLYAENPEKCLTSLRPKELSLKDYRTLHVLSVEFSSGLIGDWEADYDVEGSKGPAYITGVYPDVKYVSCENCHLTIEGQDVNEYVPEGFFDQIMEEEREAHSDEY
jgi:hypothetical protein